jgi:hypothetical protein
VNSRFLPQETVAPEPAGQTAAYAMVTASYAPDFERCRLLCETVDRHVAGISQHYILVERSDVALFRQLETSSRTVVDERDLLPSWLHAVSDPASLFRRRIWLSWKTMPLRGWHVQQLRRIAIAAHADEDILVYCDSDVVFLKPFDCGAFRSEGRLRLLRRDDALPSIGDHVAWSRNAGAVLGIAQPAVSPHDYISTLIAWSSRDVRAMCAQIEQQHGRHWVEVVCSSRKFSECMIYGRFVDEVLNGVGHFHASEEFCRVHWTGSAMSDDEFRRFVAGMSPHQVAIGMQSFIGTAIARIRRLTRAEI